MGKNTEDLTPAERLRRSFGLRSRKSEQAKHQVGDALDPDRTLGVKERDAGYRIYRGPVKAFALLGPKQFGLDVTMRLKDTGADNPGEVAFWGNLLARLVGRFGVDGFSCVTCPPSSGKRKNFYLAFELAGYVAQRCELPLEALFINRKERGHRASIQEKLREGGEYEYERELSGARILVVDDAICTRQTAERCIRAASGDHLYFLALYNA